MKLKLSKLQNNDKKVTNLRSKGQLGGWEDIKEVVYYQSLLYVPKAICFKLRSRH